MIRTLVLAAALAGCGVKAAPRPPERARAAPAAGEQRAAAARDAQGCSCALPDPLLAASTGRP
jgi:predicted small lipoprotein YifL